MVKLHTVAWTMGKQKRVTKELESQTTEIPEPGKYGFPENIGKKTEPKWSIAKDEKMKNKRDNQPGPLDYKIPSLIDEGPKFGIGSKTFYNRNPLLTETGPGDYDPEKPSTKVAYSIPGRSKDPQNLGMPGPGHYDHDKKKFIPGAGLGKDTRGKVPRKHKEASPGPGSYKVEKFAKENPAPKFGFGTDIKDKFYKTIKSSGPGPGDYSEKKVMGDGVPGYTMKDRRKDCRVLPGKDAPCAGNYNPQYSQSRKSAPKFAFAKTNKSKVADIYGHTPAPNTYSPANKFVKSQSAAWGMGSGKRPALSQVLPNPGPGQYNPKKGPGNAHSFTGKSKMYIKKAPGPGDYSPDANNIFNFSGRKMGSYPNYFRKAPGIKYRSYSPGFSLSKKEFFPT